MSAAGTLANVRVTGVVEPAATVSASDTLSGSAGPTVSSVEPLTEPRVALIVLVPGLTPRASPVARTVAAPGVADAQRTDPVRLKTAPAE